MTDAQASLSTSVGITIHRALTELKTIRSRISKILHGDGIFIGTRVVGKAYRDFAPEAKSNYQSLKDLIARYRAIKFAIITSNATTKVTILGQTMTVAEAICIKESLDSERELVTLLRQQRLNVQNEVDRHERTVQTELDKLLNNLCKNQDGRREDDQITTISEAYRKNNRIEVVDPLGVDKVISETSDYTDRFSSEVDIVLSESNSRTLIYV
jgi:hypothetical protein